MRSRQGLPGVWGLRTLEKVTAGTGEALPGPAVLRRVAVGASRSITGLRREVGSVPGGWALEVVRSTDCSCADNTTAGDGEGRCFVGACRVQGKAGECPRG
jgi:hypothetical protein